MRVGGEGERELQGEGNDRGRVQERRGCLLALRAPEACDGRRRSELGGGLQLRGEEAMTYVSRPCREQLASEQHKASCFMRPTCTHSSTCVCDPADVRV